MVLVILSIRKLVMKNLLLSLRFARGPLAFYRPTSSLFNACGPPQHVVRLPTDSTAERVVRTLRKSHASRDARSVRCSYSNVLTTSRRRFRRPDRAATEIFWYNPRATSCFLT